MDVSLLSPQIRVVMLPKDTNALGHIFGGVILSYLDLAAGEHAKSVKYGHKYVTKVMKEIEFIAPVRVGDSVSFFTKTKKLGRTSVTVTVSVLAQRGLGNETPIQVTEAEVVMVAVNDEGVPIPIL